MPSASRISQILTFEKTAELLRALAHPTRIAIIELLKSGERLSVTQIHTALNLEQAVASHHLNIMKNKKILQGKRNGKTILYSLIDPSFSQMVTYVQQVVNSTTE